MAVEVHFLIPCAAEVDGDGWLVHVGQRLGRGMLQRLFTKAQEYAAGHKSKRRDGGDGRSEGAPSGFPLADRLATRLLTGLMFAPIRAVAVTRGSHGVFPRRNDRDQSIAWKRRWCQGAANSARFLPKLKKWARIAKKTTVLVVPERNSRGHSDVFPDGVCVSCDASARKLREPSFSSQILLLLYGCGCLCNAGCARVDPGGVTRGCLLLLTQAQPALRRNPLREGGSTLGRSR